MLSCLSIRKSTAYHIRYLTSGSQVPNMANVDKAKKGRPGLKALRMDAELSQAELAQATKTTEKAVRNWENDGAIPSFDKAVLLAKTLQVSLRRLAIEFNLDPEGIPEDSDRPGGDAI